MANKPSWIDRDAPFAPFHGEGLKGSRPKAFSTVYNIKYNPSEPFCTMQLQFITNYNPPKKEVSPPDTNFGRGRSVNHMYSFTRPGMQGFK